MEMYQRNGKSRDGVQCGETRCARCMDGAYREQQDTLVGGHRRQINVFYRHVVGTAKTFSAPL